MSPAKMTARIGEILSIRDFFFIFIYFFYCSPQRVHVTLPPLLFQTFSNSECYLDKDMSEPSPNSLHYNLDLTK